MILEAPNGVQPLTGVGWAWGWTVFNEAAAATEATAFLEYTTRHARMDYTTKAKPFHYTTRSGPLHYVGRQR